MNSRFNYLRLLLGFAMLDPAFNQPSKAIGNTPAPDDIRRKLEVNKIKNRDRLLQEVKVKEWTIDGITVIARDERNAIRKVNNIKKQKHE